MNGINNYMNDSVSAVQILINKYKKSTSDKDPLDVRARHAEDIWTSPMSTPFKALALGTATGAAIGWLSHKQIEKYLTNKNKEDILAIRNELISTHTPRQNDLYKQITELNKETKSVNDTVRSILASTLFTPRNRDKFLALVIARSNDLKGKPKTKYLIILTRKYEDSLNNYQLTVYKTLFESEYRLLHKVKAINLLVLVGSTLVGALLGVLPGWDKKKDLSEFVKNNRSHLKKYR